MINTIRAKLIALVLLALFVAIAIAAAGVYSNNQLEATATRAATYGAVAQSAGLADMYHDNLRGLVEKYNSAAVAKNSERITESSKELQASAKKLRELAQSLVAVKNIGQTTQDFYVKLLPEFNAYAKSAEDIAASGSMDVAELEVKRVDFNQKFSILEKNQAESNSWLEKELAKTQELSSAAIQLSNNLMIGVISLGLIVLVLSAIGIYRSITNGLNTLETTIEKVNAGDSAARTLLTSRDELGHLGRSFDTLLDERIAMLEEKIRENENINNSAINLLQSVYALSEKDLTARADVSDDIVGTIASSVNQFADETAQTLAEVQEIAGQVRGAADAAQKQGFLVQGAAERERTLLASMGTTLGTATRQMNEVAQLSTASGAAAARTSDATKAAQAAVEGTMRGMDSLREVISETEKRFKRLGERSQEISSAVALVNTISERTHVLSLNASMQAATAGEAGRGFAVVAQEVQRLSDSSRQATGEIAQLVSNIQSETNETLITMNRLISDVVAQTELARRAGHQMTQTQAATGELVGLVQRIAAFSVQQQEMAQALQKTVQGMNDGTTQTNAAIEQQTNATSTLVQFAKRLNDSVGQFKVA
ncbi:MAG: HAMP domain-containing methyl-accepting chemotaxis protein [Burkholderiaceae bacterium]